MIVFSEPSRPSHSTGHGTTSSQLSVVSTSQGTSSSQLSVVNTSQGTTSSSPSTSTSQGTTSRPSVSTSQGTTSKPSVSTAGGTSSSLSGNQLPGGGHRRRRDRHDRSGNNAPEKKPKF